MPEMLTKYPDSALKVLKDGGAKCGIGAKQQILTSCPKENFCALPTGEICVYNLNNAHTMTQIHTFDFAELGDGLPTIFSSWNILLLAIACLFGLFFGMWLKGK